MASALVKQDRVRTALLEEAATYVTNLFEGTQISNFPFHNMSRVLGVVKDAKKLASEAKLDASDTEIVQLSAWFLLSGFAQGQPPIRKASLALAENFLTERDYPSDRIKIILDCMRAAQEPHGPFNPPMSRLEEIVSDASVAYLAKKKFLRRAELLRLENEIHRGTSFTDRDWNVFLLNRYESTRFHTAVAESLFAEQRDRNLREIEEEIASLEAGSSLASDRSKLIAKGVDTLFRTQSRNMTSLVAMADRKAHMLMGVNSIIVSVIVGGHIRGISHEVHLIFPGVILLTVNLISIGLAILSVKPTTPATTRVSHDDVIMRHGYLMSQVIFSELKYEDFQVGVRQMMQDEEYLYDTLIQNIYATARVLNKKFKLLKYAYSTFSYGIMFSVLAYGASLYFKV